MAIKIMCIISLLVGLSLACNDLRIRDWDLNDIGHVHEIEQGDLVALICDGTCQGPGFTPSLKWLRPGGRKVTSFPGRLMSVYQESRRQIKLYLQDFQMSDAGIYTCRGWINGQWRTQSVHLKIPDDISTSAPLPTTDVYMSIITPNVQLPASDEFNSEVQSLSLSDDMVV
ncbi:hypothetical protein LOTGIDRAFT_158562 [Lottia gigantea]|uniref:Ig-like domain-containing protein n=1 Tax=Lottia gigantea TaxID=225164 RepID=V4AWS7_LOTGI|nr:hypothetical protein LOTGIDRAFT_158562 [Lottia gigantea]ESO99475.1 hypothetical protein LOTGIDRAFT_158562 [Lottia gigantea]